MKNISDKLDEGYYIYFADQFWFNKDFPNLPDGIKRYVYARKIYYDKYMGFDFELKNGHPIQWFVSSHMPTIPMSIHTNDPLEAEKFLLEGV